MLRSVQMLKSTFFYLDLSILFWVYGYLAHMYFCASCMPGVCGDQKRVPVPWNWSCGKLWVTMWRLGIKPRSFAWIMFWTTQTSFQALTIFLLKPLGFINKLLAKSKKKYMWSLQLRQNTDGIFFQRLRAARIHLNFISVYLIYLDLGW